jgi:hypothetical protein
MAKLRSLSLYLLLSGLYLASVCGFGKPDLANDSSAYLEYARVQIDHGFHGQYSTGPDMHREPGYPFFIQVVLRPLEFFVGREDLLALKWIVFCQTIFFLFSVGVLVFLPGRTRKYRRIFAGLLLASPTLWGSHTIIYPESLSASLVILALAGVDRFAEKPGWFSAGWVGLLIGVQSLVRYTQFYGVIVCALFAAGFSLWSYRQGLVQRARSSALIAFLALAGGIYWPIRNHLVLEPGAYSVREPTAIAGKILRIEEADLLHNLPKALVCAVGTSLCERIYGSDACLMYEIRGSDKLGGLAWLEHTREYAGPTEKKLSAFKARYFRRYFEHPFLQILGSLIEIVRIGFWESLPAIQIRIFDAFPRVWHFGGSLLVWGFFLRGLKTLSQAGAGLRPVLGISIGWVLYHFALMSQITNLVRYVIPLLPCVYAVCAIPLARRAKAIPVRSADT